MLSGVVVSGEMKILKCFPNSLPGEGKVPCVKNVLRNSDMHSEWPKMINHILVFQSGQPRLIVGLLLKQINRIRNSQV